MRPEALIFDVDGTLAETEEVHRAAFNQTFGECGLKWHWPVDEYRLLLRTTGGKERIADYAKAVGMDLDEEFVREIHLAKTARFAELISQGDVAFRPGIGELIEEALGCGVRLAIATTTSRSNVDSLIETVTGKASTSLFEVIAAGDEVAAKKPAPDVYELALLRLGLEAKNCLAIEDSRNGLQAALGAGLRAVVSPSQYTLDEDFAGAAAVIERFDAPSRQALLN